MEIRSLLDVYKKKLIAPQKSVIASFCTIVQTKFGIAIDPERVRYTPTSRTLGVSVSSALRNELRMHEQEILSAIASDIGQKNTPKRIV